MTIPMFVDADTGAQKRQVTVWVTCLTADRGFEPGRLTPVSPISPYNLSV